MIQTITLTIDFDLNGADPQDLRTIAETAISSAMESGAFTADTGAEIRTAASTVDQSQGYDEITTYLNTLSAADALWWFMENVDEDHVARSQLYFYCRERARHADKEG